MELSQAIRQQLSQKTKSAQHALTAASVRALALVSVAAAYRRAYFTSRKLRNLSN